MNNKRLGLFGFAFFLSASLFAQSNTQLAAVLNSAKEENAGVSAIVSQTSNSSTSLIPTPQLAMSTKDYPVTAGDVYTLAFAMGNSPVTYVITVDRTYRIRVANFAVLDISGLTFPQLKSQVEAIVTKNAPMSGVQFVLTTPSVFTINITGEVNQTEVRQAWALTRLSGAVSGTFTDYSSLRNIEIVSADGTSKTYDLFKAQRYGDLTQDPFMRPGDTVVVHRSERKVSVSGAVERPGTYELLKGENLKDLVYKYGSGLTDYADVTRMELHRYNPLTKETDVSYLNMDSITDNQLLINHDEVVIVSATDLKPVMFIEGAVNVVSNDLASMDKVTVNFDKDTNYAFLVRNNKHLFSPVSDLENAYIVRRGQRIPLDLTRLLYDRSSFSEYVVEPYDVLEVPFKMYYVTVSGAVLKPGRYPYVVGRTWDYYVGLAGGFIEEKNFGEAVSITDVNGNKCKKSDPITPETTIDAKYNSFTYYFGTYAPIITTVLSIISTTVTIIAVSK